MPVNYNLCCEMCDYSEDAVVGGEAPTAHWYHWMSKTEFRHIETYRSIAFGDKVVCSECYDHRSTFYGGDFDIPALCDNCSNTVTDDNFLCDACIADPSRLDPQPITDDPW